MQKTNQDSYKFNLAFKGQLVENSVDAFDVANTILATSQILNELAEIRYGNNAKEQIQININAFKQGSLKTDFIILARDLGVIATPLIPVATNIYEIGKNVLSGYKTIIAIRKILKGKPPKSIKQIAGTKIEFTSFDNSKMEVNYYDLRGVQSRTVQTNLAKIGQTLSKEGSLIDEMDIVDVENESFVIKKEDAPYLAPLEESQLLPEIKYKGTVSKIDTKARSGYLDISNKRLSFTFPADLPEEQFIFLVESLKRKIQIYLVGSVLMDFENNPEKMQVTKVESDLKLL